MVSMLRPEKRVDLFIQAAKKVLQRGLDIEFAVAGEGPERVRLEKLIEEAGIAGRVHLLGAVGDVPGFLAALDIGVLCSDTEGLSNAIAEYMAAGLAIIASAVGGNLELLSHSETAILTRPGDADDLARAIMQLLQSPEQRGRLGKQARLAVERRFGDCDSAERHQELYRDLLHDRDRGGAPLSQRSLSKL
jgi:glycosyltransferase involved in cell wall biosynthesis